MYIIATLPISYLGSSFNKFWSGQNPWMTMQDAHGLASNTVLLSMKQNVICQQPMQVIMLADS